MTKLDMETITANLNEEQERQALAEYVLRQRGVALSGTHRIEVLRSCEIVGGAIITSNLRVSITIEECEQHSPDGVLIGDRIIGCRLDVIVTETHSATGISPPIPFGCRVIREPNTSVSDGANNPKL